MIKLNCKLCNKEYYVKPYRKNISKFCSYKCSGINNGQLKIVDKSSKCKFCNKIFNYKYNGQKFCSKKCYDNFQFQGKTINCLFCDKIIKINPSNKNRKFCSRKCMGLYKIGSKNQNFSGGKINKANGYRYITYKYRKIPEHRLVVELLIGRKLTKKEQIHHIDGNRLNNSPSNLYLFKSNSEHNIFENKFVKEQLISNIFI